MLANSEFRHELESDIEPFKGLLLGLFFITVGAGIDFGILFGDFATVIGLTLGVMRRQRHRPVRPGPTVPPGRRATVGCSRWAWPRPVSSASSC